MRIFGKAGYGIALFALAACSPLQIGSRTLDFGGGGGNAQNFPTQTTQPILPTSAAQRFGRGPVQVSLLLPLSGDPGLASVGQSLANASRLAIAFMSRSSVITAP